MTPICRSKRASIQKMRGKTGVHWRWTKGTWGGGGTKGRNACGVVVDGRVSWDDMKLQVV
jgi:hypothetical protein